jgi:hypothetical protein
MGSSTEEKRAGSDIEKQSASSLHDVEAQAKVQFDLDRKLESALTYFIGNWGTTDENGVNNAAK